MVDMSRLPNLSCCRTISRVPFGIGHCGTVIAPKTHRAALRRLNHASRFDNDSKHHSFAGQPVHLPLVGAGLVFASVNVGIPMAELLQLVLGAQ